MTNAITNSLIGFPSSKLELLKIKLNCLNDDFWESKVTSWEEDGRLNIHLKYHSQEETFLSLLCQFINTEGYADMIARFEIITIDKTSLKILDLTELFQDTNIVFSNLIEFEIERNARHDNSIIELVFDENKNDNCFKIINEKMPKLEVLKLPDLPKIFPREEVLFSEMVELEVQTNNDSDESFLTAFKEGKCFPSLKYLNLIAFNAPIEEQQCSKPKSA